MKNSSDTIGNRTRDLPTCSAVPQPTALPRAPSSTHLDVLYVTENYFIQLSFRFSAQMIQHWKIHFLLSTLLHQNSSLWVEKQTCALLINLCSLTARDLGH